MRTIWCGQVCAPNEITISACVAQACVVTVRPADGDQKAAAPPSRRAAIRVDKSSDEMFFPRSSSRNSAAPAGQLAPQLVGFVAPPLVGRLRAAFGNFGNAGEFKSNGRPALGKSLEIAVGKLLFGAGFHPAHGMH